MTEGLTSTEGIEKSMAQDHKYTKHEHGSYERFMTVKALMLYKYQ
jgi:hypothetical protein